MNENHPLHGIHFTERINSQNEQIEYLVKENEEMREGFTKMKVLSFFFSLKRSWKALEILGIL